MQAAYAVQEKFALENADDWSDEGDEDVPPPDPDKEETPSPKKETKTRTRQQPDNTVNGEGRFWVRIGHEDIEVRITPTTDIDQLIENILTLQNHSLVSEAIWIKDKRLEREAILKSKPIVFEKDQIVTLEAVQMKIKKTDVQGVVYLEFLKFSGKDNPPYFLAKVWQTSDYNLDEDGNKIDQIEYTLSQLGIHDEYEVGDEWNDKINLTCLLGDLKIYQKDSKNGKKDDPKNSQYADNFKLTVQSAAWVE